MESDGEHASKNMESDDEHTYKNMESDDEHTHKNIDNDVCNIDQSTLDIGHHFAPFAKLL